MTLKVNIHIFGFTKYTIYCKNDPGFVPVFLTMLLLCSFLRLKELFQVKNGLTKLLLFFCLKIAKIWFGRTTLNKEKKEDGPRLAKQQICTCITLFHCHHCMTTMWNYFMFHEWCNTRIFFFYLFEL